MHKKITAEELATAQPYTIPFMEQDVTERRQHKRATTLINGTVLSNQGNVEGIVLDLGVSGVKIQVAEPLPLRSRVTLALAGSVHLGGEVVWRHGRKMGVRFTDQPQRNAGIMAAFLPKTCLEVEQVQGA